MTTRISSHAAFAAAFAAGLGAVAWVGAGYRSGHALALAVTLVIAGFYLLGAWELWRYRQGTAALARALHAVPAALERLDDWLAPLPPGLGAAVRQRIEGARAGLPGPALAPYLTGLLVLLGMVGTFLGMVVTLDGTGAALAGAEGLAAIRDALSAPVRGLGLAFGTSVAGVAASAMLGLMAALARRERLHAAQRLDGLLATALRPFTPQHQREQSLRLLPTLVERIADGMAAMERQHAALAERLQADQARFYRETEAAYTGLAAAVERTLAHSAAEGARQAGAALQPAVEAALAGLARQGAELHTALAGQVRQQLEGMAGQFASATAAVTTQWSDALAAHQRASDHTAQSLRATLGDFTQALEQRSAALADGLAARLAEQSEALSARWGEALAQQAEAGAQLATRHEQALQTAAEQWAREATAQHAQRAAQDAERQAAWTQSLQAVADTQLQQWQAAQAEAAGQWRQLGAVLDSAATGIAERSAQQAERLLAQLDQRAAQDAAQQAAWTASLHALQAALREEWQQAGAHAAAQWQSASQALARSTGEITQALDAHARGTLGEIGTLVQAASEAPRAAAQVIGELRQKLEGSMERDNALLDERARILETLSTLLDGVNHAAAGQREAIDALVSTASGLMERASGGFADTVQAQAGRMDGLAAQLAGSAAEVASLGEAFGAAVQHFGQANEQLVGQLQRIEAALAKSLARSDEQLDYYVAQAREVIELSIGAQKQVMDELRHVAGQRATADEAA